MIKHALATDATNLIKPSQLKVLEHLKMTFLMLSNLLFMAFLSLLFYFFVECKPTVRVVSREMEDYKDKCNLSIIQIVRAIII